MKKKEQVRDYLNEHKYFSLSQICNQLSLDRKTVKDYLFQFKRGNLVFDAGYGIYSTIKNYFELLPKSRVDTLLHLLKGEFPYTEFVIWNTQQLQPLYHHTQQHHITFIEAEKEAVGAFFEKISPNYRDTLVEKRRKEYFNSLDIARNPVVVRNLFSRSPKRGNFPELEKILVDMLLDLDKYKYISTSDYWGIWEILFAKYRIKIGTLHNYSKRRKCFDKLFEKITNIARNYGVDLCQIIGISGKSLLR